MAFSLRSTSGRISGMMGAQGERQTVPSPNWSLLLSPQHHACLLVSRAQVK
jgi:hypothetical protein